MRVLDYTVCVSIVYVLECMYVYNDFLVLLYVCMCMCVCVYLYGTFIPIHILWVGVALVTMYVINAYQKKVTLFIVIHFIVGGLSTVVH